MIKTSNCDVIPLPPEILFIILYFLHADSCFYGRCKCFIYDINETLKRNVVKDPLSGTMHGIFDV